MKVSINNKEHKLPDNSTIGQALKSINFSDVKGTAVAVNSEVVPRDQWESKTIKNNDRILVIRATQGG